MKITLVALSLALALGSAPGAALAKGPKDCPPGLAKKSPACVPPGLARKGVTRDDHRDRDRFEDRADRDHDDWDRDDWDRYDEDDYRVLRVGDRVVLDGREYVVVDTRDGTLIRRDDRTWRLPRLDDGSEYVRVGDAIIRVDRRTRAVLDLIELTDLILS